MSAVQVVATGGRPVNNVTASAKPCYVGTNGVPVTIVTGTAGKPVILLNPDGTTWTP
jgi:hypothetical protein